MSDNILKPKLQEIFEDPDLQVILTHPSLPAYTGLLVAQPSFGVTSDYRAPLAGLLGGLKSMTDAFEAIGSIGDNNSQISRQAKDILHSFGSFTQNVNLSSKVWGSTSAEDITVQILFLNVKENDKQFQKAWDLMADSTPVLAADGGMSPPGGHNNFWNLKIGRWFQADKLLVASTQLNLFEELDASVGPGSDFANTPQAPIGATVTITFTPYQTLDRDTISNWKKQTI